MAKFQKAPDETLLGSGPMSIYQKQGLSKKPFQGKIYVTDQRVCFHMDLTGTVLMELTVPEIKGFSVKKALITTVTIHSKAGESYVFTGFPSKKLQEWLRQVGVSEI